MLSLDDAYHALVEKPIRQKEARGGNPGSLGYGPIQRRDRLGLPDDPLAIARRRLAPLVDRMRGDHKFTGGGA